MPKSTVVARYLTKGAELTGGRECTVDVTDDDRRAAAMCRGCGASHTHGSAYISTVHSWAQDHAEKCRALPRPTA